MRTRRLSELVGRARAARGGPARDSARRVRRLGLEAAGDAPLDVRGPPGRRHGLLRGARASSWRPGDGCRGRCSCSSAIAAIAAAVAIVARLAPPARPATVARAARALRVRAADLRRHPLAAVRAARRCSAGRSSGDSSMLPYRALGFGISHHLGWWVGFVALARLRRADRRRRRLPRPQRERAALGRPPRRRVLDRLAAARRADRRPSRVGEQPVGRRRRAPPLRRAAVDAARHERRRAAALAATDADAALARRLRAQRRDGDEDLERAARGGRARRRLPARTTTGHAAVPRGRARLRARRARLLADLVPEAVRQPALVAGGPVRPGARRVELDALVDLHAAHARDRRTARRRRRLGRAPPVGARARARLPPAEPASSTASTRTRRSIPRFLYASLPELFVLWAAGVAVLLSLVPQLRPAPAPTRDS